MRNLKRLPGSVLEFSKLRLIFTSDEVGFGVGVVIRRVEDRRSCSLRSCPLPIIPLSLSRDHALSVLSL